MATQEKKAPSKAELKDAARNREDYIRALNEELEGVKAQNKPERVKAVEAELARVQGAPKGRRAAARPAATPCS